MHEVLVNRLGGLSLPRKSVVRLTDRPDMTLDVYRGRKTTMQQQQRKEKKENCIRFSKCEFIHLYCTAERHIFYDVNTACDTYQKKLFPPIGTPEIEWSGASATELLVAVAGPGCHWLSCFRRKRRGIDIALASSATSCENFDIFSYSRLTGFDALLIDRMVYYKFRVIL